MVRVHETALPGVGLRHEFDVRSGGRLGVVTHRSGRREILRYAEDDDPDSARVIATLDEDESRTLAELLGGTTITKHLSEMFRQSLQGLSIEWIAIAPDWHAAGRTIADFQLRTRTGVSVVAIVRDGETDPSPGPDARMQAGDTVVVVGTPEGFERTLELLQRGPSA